MKAASGVKIYLGGTWVYGLWSTLAITGVFVIEFNKRVIAQTEILRQTVQFLVHHAAERSVVRKAACKVRTPV